jgi:hypothetical protein
LKRVERSEGMKAPQPCRSRLDRVHVDDHVTRVDQLVKPDLDHAGDRFLHAVLADEST